VPLAPWMRIGTPDWATLSIFCRAICIDAERPKIRLVGGRLPVRSPNPALEIAVVAMSPDLGSNWGERYLPPIDQMHTMNQTIFRKAFNMPQFVTLPCANIFLFFNHLNKM